MATFRGSNHQVGASSVWTNGDLANLIDNLYRQSIRAGARGEYERGLRDMAQSIADATNSEIDLYPDGRYDLQNVNVHAERITERYERIEERRFAIRGEREERPTPAQPSTQSTVPANMTDDDVNVTIFNPARGRLVEREIGFGWIGNDGYTQFWSASDWQQISAAEANAWGQLVPVEPQPWNVLVRHAYADRQRRQLAAPHASRITQNDRRLLP